jgi:hypothetical protein
MEPGRLAQDTVLFLKIVDHILLPLVQPARKRNQKLEGIFPLDGRILYQALPRVKQPIQLLIAVIAWISKSNP